MRYDEIGDAAVEADLDDLHALLGHRSATWQEGEAELERLVLADAGDGRHDETLLWLFHRQNLRAQMLNGPAGSAMAPPSDADVQPARPPSPGRRAGISCVNELN
jgi:hypothetical protein